LLLTEFLPLFASKMNRYNDSLMKFQPMSYGIGMIFFLPAATLSKKKQNISNHCMTFSSLSVTTFFTASIPFSRNVKRIF
jgi:hypothetical protein